MKLLGKISVVLALVLFVAACADKNRPNYQFMPNMYEGVGYETYQGVDNGLFPEGTLLYSRTFPVIAQAEVKSILKASGEKYKKLRDAGKPLYEMPAKGGNTTKAKKSNDKE